MRKVVILTLVTLFTCVEYSQMYKIKNTRLFSESRISIYTKYFIVPNFINFSINIHRLFPLAR